MVSRTEIPCRERSAPTNVTVTSPPCSCNQDTGWNVGQRPTDRRVPVVGPDGSEMTHEMVRSSKLAQV